MKDAEISRLDEKFARPTIFEVPFATPTYVPIQFAGISARFLNASKLNFEPDYMTTGPARLAEFPFSRCRDHG